MPIKDDEARKAYHREYMRNRRAGQKPKAEPRPKVSQMAQHRDAADLRKFVDAAPIDDVADEITRRMAEAERQERFVGYEMIELGQMLARLRKRIERDRNWYEWHNRKDCPLKLERRQINRLLKATGELEGRAPESSPTSAPEAAKTGKAPAARPLSEREKRDHEHVRDGVERLLAPYRLPDDIRKIVLAAFMAHYTDLADVALIERGILRRTFIRVLAELHPDRARTSTDQQPGGLHCLQTTRR